MSTLKIEEWWPKTVDEFCGNVVARYRANADWEMSRSVDLRNSMCSGMVGRNHCRHGGEHCEPCPGHADNLAVRKEYLLHLFAKEGLYEKKV